MVAFCILQLISDSPFWIATYSWYFIFSKEQLEQRHSSEWYSTHSQYTFYTFEIFTLSVVIFNQDHAKQIFMKVVKSLFVLLVLSVFSLTSIAADLIVEEGAIPPNYNSIQSAVDDASPGDRIFIKNKAQNVPWLETVIVDRPLGLYPLEPDSMWLLTGSITIAPDVAQFSTENEITIQGAHIFDGNITSTPAADALTAFAKVNIISNELGNGDIDIDDDNLYTHVAGNLLTNGFLTIGYGIISGNQVAGSIGVADINNGTNDTTYIVGNRIINGSNGYPGQINWATNENYFYIANNYIRFNGASNRCIYISSLLTGGSGGHTIVNNTIESGGSYTDGIFIINTVSAGTQISIVNNAFYDNSVGENGSSGEYVVDFNSISGAAVVLLNYNVYQNYDGGLTDISINTPGLYAEGNTESVSVTYDPDNITGECLDADCINTGSPDNLYTDLDLSRNDRGTAGGSFNYNNFWPILTGGARVYLVQTPRTVIQGNTIDAEIDAFDR